MNKIKALTEGVTQDLIAYLIEDNNISIEDAMKLLYSSEIFSKLSDSETGLYRESSAYVMTLLNDEMINGNIIQHEM